MLGVLPSAQSFKRKERALSPEEDTNTTSSTSSTNSSVNVYDELDYFHCGSRKARCVSSSQEEVVIGYDLIAPSRSELQYNSYEGNQALVLRKIYSPATALRSPVELSLQHPDDCCSMDMISRFAPYKSSAPQPPFMYMPKAEKPQLLQPPLSQNTSFSASLLTALGVPAPPTRPQFALQKDAWYLRGADVDLHAHSDPTATVPQLWSDFDDDSLDSPDTKKAIASLRRGQGHGRGQAAPTQNAGNLDQQAVWVESASYLASAFTSMHNKSLIQGGCGQVTARNVAYLEQNSPALAADSRACAGVTPGLSPGLETPQSGGGGGGGVLQAAESLWNSICEFVNEDSAE
jgi:hypothetical protein